MYLVSAALALCCIVFLEVHSAHGLCYIAMRGTGIGVGGGASVVVQSDAGGSHYQTQFSITDGDRVYCVPTLCPQSSSTPSKVSYYHFSFNNNNIGCDDNGAEYAVYPGNPTCYGSKSACESDSTPNILFSATCKCKRCF